MRIRPRKFANFSINTGGWSSFSTGIIRTVKVELVCTTVDQFVC
jgi:hypothetical protein